MAYERKEPKKIYIGQNATPRLPIEYQEVEYIESSGTQYINPGLSILNGEKFKIDIDFYWFNQSDGIMFGQYTNSSQGNVMQFGIISSDFWNRFFADSQTPGTWTPNSYTANTRYNFVFEGTAPINQTFNPYLFAQNQGSIAGISIARLYSCKLWIDDVLERDFVPCYRIADSVIGLYDVVNDVFYTNSGSGTFSKGADVNIPYKDIKKVYLGSTLIRPRWTPGVNTVAYYPLTSQTTVNDESGNSNTLTNVGVSFITYNGVSCARITGNTDSPHNPLAYLYGNISGLPTGANPRTYNLWIYQDNAASSRNATYIFQGMASTNSMVYVAQGLDGSGNAFISQYGAGSSTTPPTIGQRHNVVIVYDGSKFVYYVNAVEKIVWTYTINTSGNKFSIGGASENQGWNSFNGAFSNVILEDKARTAQEVADYYDQTKSNYGL